MVSSLSSDATRKRVVFTVGDKLKACEMVRKKVPQKSKHLKRECSRSLTNMTCLFGAVPFYNLIYVQGI